MLSLSRKVRFNAPRFATSSRGMSSKQEFANDSHSRKKNLELLVKFDDTTHEVFSQKLTFPPEVKAEHNRRGREYGRQSLIYHNKIIKDFSVKRWLQSEAIKALPEDLRVHALAEDVEDLPPSWRPWPHFDTPPIPGFDYRDYISPSDLASPRGVFEEDEDLENDEDDYEEENDEYY